MMFFYRLAELANELQKHTGIATAAAALVVFGPALVPKLSLKARSTRIILLLIGLIILVWGILLAYAKLTKPTIKVPLTALILILATGAVFLLFYGILWWNQRRTSRRRVSDLTDAAANHIRVYQQKLGTKFYIDEVTIDDESVMLRLASLIRQLRRGQRIFLVGQLGVGKTSTLLKFATDCSRLRSASGHPLIAIYVDLADYAARAAQNSQLLHEYILSQFGEATQRKIKDAWDQPGLDVDWVFVFDNADEAGLRWPTGQRPWDFEVSAFINRPSDLAPFHAVIASHPAPASSEMDNAVWLKGLPVIGMDKLLTQAQVNPADVAALARDKSFNQYLANPSTLGLLTPTLARRTWTKSYNVHVAMGDAIDRVMRRSQLSTADYDSLLSSAASVVTFLRTRPDTDPEAPGELNEVVAHLASNRRQSQRSMRRELMVLTDCGIVNRVPGRGGTEYVQVGPAVAAYFYACALLDDPSLIEVSDLLLESHSRLTVLSLLKVADGEIVSRFTQVVEQMLDKAIADLSRMQQPLVVTPNPPKPKWTEQTDSAFVALSVLIDGLQDRLELLGEQFTAKAIELTSLITPIAPTQIQADLPEVSYALGAPEQAMSIIARGLGTGDGAQVLDATSRMVNAMSEVTSLDEYQGQLVRVIILAGLRSLTLNRGRDDVPYVLRLADSAGAAAIILYGVVFGLAGLLQLSEYWRHPSAQVLEVIVAMLVVVPMVAARYNDRWRRYILGKDIKNIMLGISGFLALFGGTGGAIFILGDLATFTLELMPLVICYSLIWPVAALYYLESEPRPTLASVIFPLPRNIQTLWRTNVAERSRSGRNNR